MNWFAFLRHMSALYPTRNYGGQFPPAHRPNWKQKTRRYAHHDAKKARCRRG